MVEVFYIKSAMAFEKQGESVQGTDILKLGKSFRAIVGYMPQQQGFMRIFPQEHFLSIWQRLKE